MKRYLWLGLLLFPLSSLAQTPDSAARLMQNPSVRKALDRIKQNEPAIIEEQIRLCEIAAPPFHEQERAAAYKRVFEGLGLKNVRIDKVGNVLGERPGRSPRPHLVIEAHLDTVFPEGTNVKVTRQGNILKAPGIGDDTRGLAVLIGVIRAMNEEKLETEGSITFAGVVGEEGLGDLRGVKHLFQEELKGKIDRFIAIDGTGLGITNIAVGSFRYKVTFKGPGGHSYGAFGMPNPIHAMGRAISKISEFKVPTQPKTTFNVGRVGGGTSVNAIPFEAWMEMDMRSPDPASLNALEQQFNLAVEQAALEENTRWHKEKVITVTNELVGNRPAGRTAETAPLVQTVVAVTKALGGEGKLSEGSTDSNIPMSLNIPAVTISGGGQGAGTHAPEESFDTTDSWKGTQRALLVVLALTEK